MERRLAAILAADVVGYSRLVGKDEEGTLRMLSAYREVIDGLVAEHRGRVFGSAGDSVIAEFASPVEAVRCAVEFQRELGKRNTDLPDDRRMEFRVGVNLGDVVVDGGNLLGNGVNVAARLEELAEPGGVYISDDVYRQVEGKVELGFSDLGDQSVKNIVKPVRVHRVMLDEPGSVASLGAKDALSLPDKPSIAVLPFDNLSGDLEQEFFADGMAEDIITGLSRCRWFFVIARNSSFTYKGHAVDVKLVSRELGVRYVVEGSVRKAGNRVRITAQLIDATTGNHIWADRYDRELDDIFALQDEITETIVATIEPELGAVERERAVRKPPDNLDAWDSYHRGLWHFYGDWTRDGVAEAKRLLLRACDLDPGFAAAYAELAFAHIADIIRGFSDDPEVSLEQAAVAAEKAVTLDARDPAAHCAQGRVLIYKQAYEKAIAEMEAALDLNANSDRAYYCLGLALLYGGRPEESIPQLEKAIRLNPRSPMLWAYLNNLGRAYFKLERYEEAMELFDKAIQQPNVTYLPFVHTAATLGHLGRFDEARAMLSEVEKRKPDFSAYTVKSTVGVYGRHSGTEQIIDGLRKAGMR
jgi:TolB-like protein/Tfp pilus assembly protein PilF